MSGSEDRSARLDLAKLHSTIDVLASGVTSNIAKSGAVKRAGGIDEARLHERVADLLAEETRDVRRHLGEPVRDCATARLNAAAPALLESLKDAVAPFAGDQSPPRWVAVARAVIAQAEGAQP